ncbi:hypothetical protein [Luteolibacter luteus]|uniref:Metallopeptidase family protein n=1 Tax=Luteolibacter luteus TaxID=2728835 RepID=A0A858RKZ2_9BACT|nr:hypothetical protein [Luteolibacter luteus]QJE97996.1 hypothetical protein HHL09_20120 [Luteolibacter luteus]
MIHTPAHRPLLDAILAHYGFRPECLSIVPDVAAAGTAAGFPDNEPLRAAKVLVGGPEPVIWLREEFSDDLRDAYIEDTCRTLTGGWCWTIGIKLTEPATFVAHLLLHEIGHFLKYPHDSPESERAAEAWALEQSRNF